MHPPPPSCPTPMSWHISKILGAIPTCEGTWRFVTKNCSNDIALVLQILAGKKWFYLNHSSVPFITCLKIPKSHIMIFVIMLPAYVILLWPFKNSVFHLAILTFRSATPHFSDAAARPTAAYHHLSLTISCLCIITLVITEIAAASVSMMVPPKPIQCQMP